MAPSVVTRALTKRFGERLAIDASDIELPAGVVRGFVDPNGAGRTTTIQLLLGLCPPSSGSAEALGRCNSSYGHALVTLAVHMAAVAAGTLWLFRRRDA